MHRVPLAIANDSFFQVICSAQPEWDGDDHNGRSHSFVSHPFPKEGKGWGTHIRFPYVVSRVRQSLP
jgi:hypothetical protein